jgi:membrane-bound metal-dependent hydrolase YbcI (DUF457 family)
MAQAGIHGLVSLVVKKWTPGKEWLVLGIVLGSILPDADNLVVAIATVAKLPTEGIHRTFTHSLFTILFIVIVFYLVALVTKQSRWQYLGIGLGIGILLHILLDLIIWFNGVAILWPIPSWINFWQNVTVPVWFDKLMQPTEFLFFALFLFTLGVAARKARTDSEYLSTLRIWTIIQVVLLVIFTVLVYTMSKGFMTIYGVTYLLSLGLVTGITIRMRKTVETAG